MALTAEWVTHARGEGYFTLRFYPTQEAADRLAPYDTVATLRADLEKARADGAELQRIVGETQAALGPHFLKLMHDLLKKCWAHMKISDLGISVGSVKIKANIKDFPLIPR